MKVRIIVRPTGLLNGQEWPEVGGTIDLPKAVADGMIEAGHVEAVGEKKAEKKAEAPPKSEEKRPASQSGAEKRAEKKA